MGIDEKLIELLKRDISEQELQGSVGILSDVFNKGIETGMIGEEEHDAFFTRLDGVLGEIYKAKKDLSKLRKVRKQVTRGGKTFMQTVYVKAGEEQKEGEQNVVAAKKEPQDFTYSGVRVRTSIDRSGGQETVVYQAPDISSKKFHDKEKLFEEIDNLSDIKYKKSF